MTTRSAAAWSPEVLNGRLLIVLAAVLWSTSGFFAAADVFHTWPIEERGPLLAFWRAFVASIVLWPMVRSPRWSWKLIPMVIAFALMNFTYLNAIVWAGPTNAIWLQYTAPVWVFIIGVTCFGERVHARDWMMISAATVGVAIILSFEIAFSPAPTKSIGVLHGVLSGVFFGAVVLSIRQLRGFDPAWLIALNLTVTAIVFLPLILYYNRWPLGGQWYYLIGFGALQIGIPYVLFARGLRVISGHEASCISLLEPILVPVWVYLAWAQAPSLTTLIGGALICTGLLLRYLGPPEPVSAGGAPAGPQLEDEEAAE